MKRLRVITFAFLSLLLVFPHTSAAMQGDGMYSGCDSPAKETLAATTTTVDFNAACDTFRACIATEGYWEPSCQLRAVVILQESCTESPQVCRHVTALYAEMIHLFDYCNGFCDRGEGSQQQALSAVRDGLLAYDQHDYTAALNDFTFQSNSVSESTLAFARAIVHWSAGDMEAALAETELALQQPYGTAMKQLVYAELQGGTGSTEYAALLTEQIRRQLPEGGFEPLFASMLTDYPFSDANWETWHWLPIESYETSPGGSFHIDLSQEPSRPIRVGFSTDRQYMMIEGLIPEEECRLITNCFPFIILENGGGNYSAVVVPDVGDGEFSVYLTRTDGYFTGIRRSGAYEWRGSTDFFIAPLAVSDPRVELPGVRCGVRSRLQNGLSSVRRVYVGGELTFPIFDQPGGREIDQLDFIETTLTISGEGVCRDQVMWWPVTSEQATGWIAENEGIRYLFDPPVP